VLRSYLPRLLVNVVKDASTLLLDKPSAQNRRKKAGNDLSLPASECV